MRRFVSLADLHLVGPTTVRLQSGIDGQVTNSDVQHFHEGEKRIFDQRYIQLLQPRDQDLVIPQDDSYLQKQTIDLSRYKNQSKVGTIFKDFSREQVNNIQVSKQADIMVLFYLLEDKFDLATKQANWDYYEPKTLHDSSLSLSTHSVLACDMDDRALAYELFERAARIDLGPAMNTSDFGIHTASIGGIWQSVVFGFAGVRMLNGELRINPRLPNQWQRLAFPLNWRGEHLDIELTHKLLTIRRAGDNNNEITLTVNGQMLTLEQFTTVTL